jgi:nucleolar GTP-binding protein
MVVYNFKRITVVPSGEDFVDLTLSKTQRKTPTVVHPNYQISRIRQFYMRKVKYTQQNFHDRLALILEQFPILDDIHPFYADLMNVLYDKDHYKLALGQLATARRLIDGVGSDYVKLLKYGDSLYRCKQLKRAALGRMCTIVKKQHASLAYLEQVRQHLSRLPSIDPNTRTLLMTGFPNVGKSSFLNKVSRADVDVQPYAFTTKSLFIGHTDYQYLRWQCIDTPGILDHPLDERNTIEMQAITAMAHLRAAILFIIDISEQCGYTIAQQVSLLNSIRPLFSRKPLIVVLNKTDVRKFSDLSADDQGLINAAVEKAGPPDLVRCIHMSNVNDEGVMEVKTTACDLLLQQRVEQKLAGKASGDILSRLHVAQPKPRDTYSRPRVIPDSVQFAREKQLSGQQSHLSTEKEAPGRFPDEDYEDVAPPDEEAVWLHNLNTIKQWKQKYQLENDEWRFDIIPEIIDGKNIADFVDPQIDARLATMDQEEDARMEAWAREKAAYDQEDAATEFSAAQYAAAHDLREDKVLSRELHRRAKGTQNHPTMPRVHRRRENSELDDHLADIGVRESFRDSTLESARGRKRVRELTLQEEAERLRDEQEEEEGQGQGHGGEEGGEASQIGFGGGDDDDVMLDDGGKDGGDRPGKRARLASRTRSLSRERAGRRMRSQSPGFASEEAHALAQEMIQKQDKKRNKRVKEARKGEADRHVFDFMPKHLYSGKRGIGKTDRR